jgi:acetoin utilization deacetylase AcuC-like enzyme
MDKYRRLRQRVASADHHREDPLIVPPAASDEELLLAHCPGYIQRVHNGELSEAEVRRIGFPWSPKMAERSRRSTGATIAAGRAALQDGCAANLAGGTHHAYADCGEGYCVFNDSAVAMRVLGQEGLIRRGIVVDCDVHQGNGTASILDGDDRYYTFSIHGAKNFPSRKHPSDLDVPLPDGVDDTQYLDALAKGLDIAFAAGPFDLVIYLAGADPYEGDRLGRLKVTKRGLEQRDRLVIDRCGELKIPIAITMAGGYAKEIDDIVDIHAKTLEIATEVW